MPNNVLLNARRPWLHGRGLLQGLRLPLSGAGFAGIALVLAGYASHASGTDLFIAKVIYSHFHGFPRQAFFLKSVMHDGMRGAAIVMLALLGVMALWDAVRPLPGLSGIRIRLRVFLVCAAVFIGGVAALKSFTAPPCPWDLTLFGGSRILADGTDIFRTDLLGRGRCFPAGHSTSGYVWLCGAFLFARGPRRFKRMFFSILPLGLSLSATQILRGAHFLSHELTTLGLALILFSQVPRFFSITPALHSGGVSDDRQN